MTATDELCLPNDTNELDMLLSERGQEHRVWPSGLVVWHDERTVYEYEPAKNHHDEYWGGILRMTMRHLTPAQAIAATLRSGTCRRLPADNFGTTCVVRGHGYEMEFGYWKCSECGTNCFDGARYCMNCGARVVDAC